MLEPGRSCSHPAFNLRPSCLCLRFCSSSESKGRYRKWGHCSTLRGSFFSEKEHHGPQDPNYSLVNSFLDVILSCKDQMVSSISLHLWVQISQRCSKAHLNLHALSNQGKGILGKGNDKKKEMTADKTDQKGMEPKSHKAKNSTNKTKTRVGISKRSFNIIMGWPRNPKLVWQRVKFDIFPQIGKQTSVWEISHTKLRPQP